MEARQWLRETGLRHSRCPGCGLHILDRVGVHSSNLVSVGYEADEGELSGTLEVEFRRGVIYQYTGVPEWEYKALVFARSPGQYLLRNIVDTYEGQRIE